MDPERDASSPPAPLEALYVNYLQVGRTPREIILEFGQFHNGDEAPRILARLVTHPDYAEEFLILLAEALHHQRKESHENPGSRERPH